MPELSKAIARLMEERERAQPQAGAAPDAPKLREVLDAVRTRIAPGEQPLATAFVRQLFDKTGADLLSSARVTDLTGLALTAFRFLAERSLEEPRVQVFDPDHMPEGWEVPCTVVETVMRDRPFIVDTTRECLRQCGCTVQRLLHPVVAVERDPRGALLSVAPPRATIGRRESFVHVEVERVPDPTALTALLTERLGEVVRATDDYQAMRGKAADLADQLRQRPLPAPWNSDVDEVAAFFDWLGQKSFVFLGYREYEFSGRGTERTGMVRPHSGLGILRAEQRSTYASPQPLGEALRRRLSEPPLLIISKTNAESPIHRRAHMDYIGVKEIDSAGVAVGERRFLGLFTAKAYAEDPTAVPFMRRKLAAIIEAEEAAEDSHDYKAIATLFNSLPEVDRLATPAGELRAEINAILAAEGGSDVKVLQRPDALARGVFIVVILPRDRFSDELYRRVEARLAHALSATAVLDHRLAMDDSDQVRLHFYFAVPEAQAGAAEPEELRSAVTELLRTWDDRLRDALLEEYGRDAARVLGERYTTAFSVHYQAATDIPQAIRDIRCLEALRATRTVQVDITNDSRAADDASAGAFTALKLYLAGEELVLSEFLPVLEDLGLKVFNEDPLDVTLPELGRVHMRTFFVQDAAGAPLDVAAATVLLKPTLVGLHGGRIESDRLNMLILQAGLDWRQVDLLRTYVNHGAQIGTAPSRRALESALVHSPSAARALWEYFAAKFDPLLPAPAKQRLDRTLPPVEERFLASLDAVPSVADDRTLRALFSAVAATVRTNFFQPAADGTADGPRAIAVKFASAQIPHLPLPHPEYEVYVHAPHVEALHLRAAKVARGGIRLSDRPDDLRTEILGLMKTQTVKNAVIVPAGAKGGFVVKRRGGAPVTSGHVVAAYRTFISALLDLSDNIVEGRLGPQPGLLPYDDPDPYLVVAADKGTATFSDIANEIAAQHRFWLSDAFASGGTYGYDHKKEGITARGAWECVKRHFREMGRDAERETLTIIGIGDMSGDVFGNGLLLSRRFCLQAAFNHQYIFLDPQPDPARSFAERERLFQLPQSTWADYNTSLLSPGGGVFPRQAKAVPLTPALRALLGVEGESATGEDVVRAILRMPADLLWNGGIGTYVKATDETAAAVGDSANDAVRINGAEIRAAVVAEGGNLGFTQRGRMEYALNGGRINTDAIDNSAGVDMSDHEVNLKITLAAALDSGHLGLADRNQLLTELTADVTRRVLAHNCRQARMLSLDQLRSQTRLNDFRALMTHLEGDRMLDRRLECLPDRDTLRNRRAHFLGLTRPELAVLLAHSKLALQKDVLASALPDDAFFEPYLRDYFPNAVDARFGPAVRSHRLRREIITVELANRLIDTMGATFVTRVSRDTGAEAAVVTRAWAVVVAVSGVADVWTAIDDADPPLAPPAETGCWFALEAAIERATKWIVETQSPEEAAVDLTGRLTGPVEELLRLLPEVSTGVAQPQLSATAEALVTAGTPRPLAQRIVTLDRLAELFEIAHITADLADDPGAASHATTAAAYYGVGDLVDLDWVRQHLVELPAEDRWERRAVEALSAGLLYAHRQLTRNILAGHHGGGPVDQWVKKYVDDHHTELERLRAVIDDLKSARRPTLAALMVVIRELERLASSTA